MSAKSYEVIRYFLKDGIRPIRLQDGLTLDEALSICRINNGRDYPKGEGWTWFDIAQHKGLF